MSCSTFPTSSRRNVAQFGGCLPPNRVMDLGQEVVDSQFHGDQTWLVGQIWVGINNPNPVIYARNHDFVLGW